MKFHSHYYCCLLSYFGYGLKFNTFSACIFVLWKPLLVHYWVVVWERVFQSFVTGHLVITPIHNIKKLLFFHIHLPYTLMWCSFPAVSIFIMSFVYENTCQSQNVQHIKVKVARYSFSGPIPPKFEHKLCRHKQRFGKIDTTFLLDMIRVATTSELS